MVTLCGVYLPEYRVLSSTETRVSELIMQHIPYDTYDPGVKQKKNCHYDEISFKAEQKTEILKSVRLPR